MWCVCSLIFVYILYFHGSHFLYGSYSSSFLFVIFNAGMFLQFEDGWKTLVDYKLDTIDQLFHYSRADGFSHS